MTTVPDPQDPNRLPRLVRLYLRQVAVGFALALVFVALLLGFNIANLRHLVTATQGGWLAVFLLVFFNGLVFAAVQFAITIMRMADHDDDGPQGGHRPPVGRLAPIRISTR